MNAVATLHHAANGIRERWGGDPYQEAVADLLAAEARFAEHEGVPPRKEAVALACAYIASSS